MKLSTMQNLDEDNEKFEGENLLTFSEYKWG
jgi:hypothetical protein